MAGPSFPRPSVRSRTRRRDPLGRRAGGALVAVTAALGALVTAGTPVAASAGAAPIDRSCTLTPIQDRSRVADATVQQLVDASVGAAAALDVTQAVAVVDRADGHLVAVSNGHRLFNAESMVKLYTAAYYLAQAEGAPDEDLQAQLQQLITVSDNAVQIDLWQPEIIATVVERYGLSDSRNGPSSGPNSWGSDRVSAQDLAQFLAAAGDDPQVGPWLLRWMAQTRPEGADTFDQDFGLNAVAGEHGSKQGWSDPDWTPYNLHSAGWTGSWWVAILQTSPTASSATMRSTSTCLAQSLAGGQPRGADRDLGDLVVDELGDAVDAVRQLLAQVTDGPLTAPTGTSG